MNRNKRFRLTSFPTRSDIVAAKRLAKAVSTKLWQMMEADAR
jgi:hypothetical protein